MTNVIALYECMFSTLMENTSVATNVPYRMCKNWGTERYFVQTVNVITGAGDINLKENHTLYRSNRR